MKPEIVVYESEDLNNDSDEFIEDLQKMLRRNNGNVGISLSSSSSGAVYVGIGKVGIRAKDVKRAAKEQGYIDDDEE